MQRGKAALTDAELLAILIGMGTVDYSAVDVGKMVLDIAKGNLNELAKLSMKDLMKVKGIGEAKAITIMAALELGRRRKESEVLRQRRISSAKDAYDEIRPYLLDKPHEEFWILLLNRANEVLKPVQISSGGVAGTVADPKLIFKHALEQLASSIILSTTIPPVTSRPAKPTKTSPVN